MKGRFASVEALHREDETSYSLFRAAADDIRDLLPVFGAKRDGYPGNWCGERVESLQLITAANVKKKLLRLMRGNCFCCCFGKCAGRYCQGHSHAGGTAGFYGVETGEGD